MKLESSHLKGCEYKSPLELCCWCSFLVSGARDLQQGSGFIVLDAHTHSQKDNSCFKELIVGTASLILPSRNSQNGE